jgi:hypothetical protein
MMANKGSFAGRRIALEPVFRTLLAGVTEH